MAAWVDAHRGEVFAALLAADGILLQPATALTPDATLQAWEDRLAPEASVRFVGDAAIRYRETITARLGARAIIAEEVPTLAGAVGRIAANASGRAVPPHAIAPLYIRRPDAEIARDRRLDRSGGDQG